MEYFTSRWAFHGFNTLCFASGGSSPPHRALKLWNDYFVLDYSLNISPKMAKNATDVSFFSSNPERVTKESRFLPRDIDLLFYCAHRCDPTSHQLQREIPT